MLCVFFFLCLCTRESVEIMLEFQTLGVVSDSAEKNQKKMTEKREFLRKTSFRPNQFFYMVVIQKLITVNT
ncbi:Uncharacterized protein FWK35_00037138, partial [Aphis craccivora]